MLDVHFFTLVVFKGCGIALFLKPLDFLKRGFYTLSPRKNQQLISDLVARGSSAARVIIDRILSYSKYCAHLYSIKFKLLHYLFNFNHGMSINPR